MDIFNHILEHITDIKEYGNKSYDITEEAGKEVTLRFSINIYRI